MDFWPHDLIGWVGVGVPFFAGLSWVLKSTVGNQLTILATQIERLNGMLNSFDKRIDDIDRRTFRLEIMNGIETERNKHDDNTGD